MAMNYDNPFPGMNPYLEDPLIWPGFHNRLIANMADDVGTRVPDNYRVDIQERTEVVTIGEENGVAVKVAAPDEARVTYLYVQRMPDWKVVTVVEVLSPTNKIPGDGKVSYLHKREEIFASGVSLVEIDLLRGGRPMPLQTVAPPSHYRILISRGWERPDAILFPFSVQQTIPKFTLPLSPADDEPEIDLGPIINAMHRTARYGQVTRYADPPPGPMFTGDYQEWIFGRLEGFRAESNRGE